MNVTKPPRTEFWRVDPPVLTKEEFIARYLRPAMVRLFDQFDRAIQ